MLILPIKDDEIVELRRTRKAVVMCVLQGVYFATEKPSSYRKQRPVDQGRGLRILQKLGRWSSIEGRPYHTKKSGWAILSVTQSGSYATGDTVYSQQDFLACSRPGLRIARISKECLILEMSFFISRITRTTFTGTFNDCLSYDFLKIGFYINWFENIKKCAVYS